MRGLATDADPRPVAAVVLAAGAATRFGAPKQGLLLAEVLGRLRESGEIGEIVVVAGAYELEADARIVHCAEWELGPGASLRCGLRRSRGHARRGRDPRRWARPLAAGDRSGRRRLA